MVPSYPKYGDSTYLPFGRCKESAIDMNVSWPNSPFTSKHIKVASINLTKQLDILTSTVSCPL